MRTKIFLAGVLCPFAFVAACVGDDPSTTGVSSSNDASVEQDATTSDGATASDSGKSNDASITDSAAAPDADDGGIAAINGLSLWLEADGLTPGLLGSWNDQSPHHNNASAPANELPFVNAPGININGHSVVTFDGGLPCLIASDDVSLQPDSSGFLIEIVERSPAGTTSSDTLPLVMFDKSQNAAPFAGPSVLLKHDTTAEHATTFTTSIDTDAATTSTTTIDDTQPHRIKMLITNVSGSACSLSVQVDSTTPITRGVLAEPNWAAVGQSLYLGGSSSVFGFPFTGDFAAVIVVKAPSPDDVARVDTYLKNRFGR